MCSVSKIEDAYLHLNLLSATTAHSSFYNSISLKQHCKLFVLSFCAQRPLQITLYFLTHCTGVPPCSSVYQVCANCIFIWLGSAFSEGGKAKQSPKNLRLKQTCMFAVGFFKTRDLWDED